MRDHHSAVSEARCSEVSLRAGEALGATATSAEQWLLVEVAGSWPAEVSAAEPLPEQARLALAGWLARTPESRLLFIRRPGRDLDRTLVYRVHATEADGEVRRIELGRPEELAGVDLASEGDLVEPRLVLVCGHGSRDSCCALRGTAVYGALARGLAAEELWISSHQGGHRFAANVLVLPAALQFGRVEPSEAPSLVARALAGRIELSRYRGRTAYARPVQAAERAVREAGALEDVADLRLLDVDGDVVRFRSADGRIHAALVEESPGSSVPASCGAEPAPQKAFTARIV